MAQPSINTSQLQWATSPLIPGDVVAPDSNHMLHGFQTAEEPPHSYFNYWMNVVYLWLVYLQNIAGEAITWTARETFTAGVTMNMTTNAGPTLAVNGGTTAGDGHSALVGFVNASGTGTGSGNKESHMNFGFSGSSPSTTNHSAGIGGFADGTTGTDTYGGFFAAYNGATAIRARNYAATGLQTGIYVDGQFAVGGTDGTLLSDVPGLVTVDNSLLPLDGRRSAGILSKGATFGWAFAGIGGVATVTQTGGTGAVFLGGAQGVASSSAGGGTAIVATGGSVDGTVNSLCQAGFGMTVTGGNINSDANSRTGGTGLFIAGGQGQAGYGNAIDALNGNVRVRSGNLSVENGALSVSSTSTLTVGGPTRFNNDVQFTNSMEAFVVVISGLLSALGGLAVTGGMTVTGTTSLAIPATTAVPITSPWTGLSGNVPGYWKDAQAMVRVQGAAVGTGTGLTIGVLPSGFRPLAQREFACTTSGNAFVQVIVDTSGNILVGATTSATIYLDNICFRTT